MPTTCSIPIARITSDEMRALDREVMRLAFGVHTELGCLCDETVYQARLADRLVAAGFEADHEVSLLLRFRDFEKHLYLDLVVNRQAIYELKTASTLTSAHEGQLMSYLFAANAERGKLVNFRPASVESRFVNAVLDDSQRRRFAIDVQHWSGPESFREMIAELVSDWGTGLDQSLYLQAVVHCLGGDYVVTRQVPMHLEACSMGNQRFHLLPDGAAFRITTFQGDLHAGHSQQFRKLMAPSTVGTLHWVNIGHQRLTLQTILK